MENDIEKLLQTCENACKNDVLIGIGKINLKSNNKNDDWQTYHRIIFDITKQKPMTNVL